MPTLENIFKIVERKRKSLVIIKKIPSLLLLTFSSDLFSCVLVFNLQFHIPYKVKAKFCCLTNDLFLTPWP